jgi:hypothetical protein
MVDANVVMNGQAAWPLTGPARAALVVGVLTVAGCGNSTGSDSADAARPSGGEGGLADGPASCPAFAIALPDRHCTDSEGGAVTIPVILSQCVGQSDGGNDAANPDTLPFDRETPVEVDDDECKLHIVMRRSCGGSGGEMSFLVSAALRVDATPASGAEPYIEAFLGLTHVAPNRHAATTELSPGTYAIGPVLLDQSGLWTVVLHLYGTCLSVPGSPHAHATFAMSMP